MTYYKISVIIYFLSRGLPRSTTVARARAGACQPVAVLPHKVALQGVRLCDIDATAPTIQRVSRQLALGTCVVMLQVINPGFLIIGLIINDRLTGGHCSPPSTTAKACL